MLWRFRGAFGELIMALNIFEEVLETIHFVSICVGLKAQGSWLNVREFSRVEFPQHGGGPQYRL